MGGENPTHCEVALRVHSFCKSDLSEPMKEWPIGVVLFFAVSAFCNFVQETAFLERGTPDSGKTF